MGKYNAKVMATPAARQLARERQIKLKGIKGHGEFGSLTKADVEKLPSGKRITSLARKVAEYYDIELSAVNESIIRKETILRYIEGRTVSPIGSDAVVELSAMRRVIAERMKESMDIAPQYTIFAEYDVSKLLRRYESERSGAIASFGTKITFTDILVKLAAYALCRHELVNASLFDGRIHYHNNVNIGVAVAMNDGLIVPVIRSVQTKNLIEISQEREMLVNNARLGQLTEYDMTDGTFTLSNLGMYPVDQMTPIINQPESAIMGVGRVIKKPVVIDDDKIAIRPMIFFSVTADHRLIDGAVLAEFMKTINDCMENPEIFLSKEE